MDDLDHALAAMPTGEALAEALDRTSPYYQPCPKCRGTGRFVGYTGRVLGECYTCKGRGGTMRKTTEAERQARRDTETAKADRRANENRRAFAETHPAEFEWLAATAPRWELAQSLLDAVAKWGDLTDKQLLVVQSGMQRDAQRSADRAAAAQPVDTDKLVEAFAAARANGLKRPVLRFDGLTASLAPATGRNAGAVYLKSGGDYVGKIADGRYHPAGGVGNAAAIAERVRTAMVDPVAAAIAYGRATGTCSCCGRTLTDPASVAAGIGPICASRFGW